MLPDARSRRHNVRMDHDDLPLSVLLREARGAFGTVIRIAIADAKLPALPREGAYIVGGLHFEQIPLANLIHHREKSIERHQTISHLVKSGYLAEHDGELELTELGVRAAETFAESVRGLYHELGHAVGEEGVATLRKALLALIEIKENAEDDARAAHGHPHDHGHEHADDEH